MERFFGSESLLAQRLEHFEPRPGQLEMAQAVAELFDEEHSQEFPAGGPAQCLVIEAETGLGKTLAYLIPAVLSGRRVVVSTNTKNLQDQILEREIPFIRQHIDPDLTVTCVKGRQNYLCLYRLHQARSDKQSAFFPDDAFSRITRWLEHTRFADRAELDWLEGNSPLWQRICCQSHFCLGSDCPEGAACYLNRLRREAAASRLLVVNHHLLFSDLAVRRSGHGEVLPRYEAVIFDEAHHVEQVATQFFGHSFSRYQVLDLCGDLERSAQAGLFGDQRQDLLRATGLLLSLMEQWVGLFPVQRGRFPLQGLLENGPQLQSCRDQILSALRRLADLLESLESSEEPWEQYRLRVEDLADRLQLITAEPCHDLPTEEIRFVHWYERGEKNISLSASPIDVAPSLQATLFAETSRVVFTSATISTGGDFSYFCNRLGLTGDCSTLSLPSPFDYPKRTLLYIPPDGFPEPSSPEAPPAAHGQMAELLRHSDGRALLLFTSFATMERAYQALKSQVEHPLLLQGTAPRHTLLQRFAQEKHSVLLGVASFWEGVDVPGDSLGLVIIDKLPFEVPSDPVIMARIAHIRAAGGNPFYDFQIPRAILSLRQGFGRLMRRGSDRGVVALLDIRICNKGYGKRFLRSLPPSRLCRTLDGVAEFYQAGM